MTPSESDEVQRKGGDYDPEEVRQAANAYVETHRKELFAAYEQMPETQGGRYISDELWERLLLSRLDQIMDWRKKVHQ